MKHRFILLVAPLLLIGAVGCIKRAVEEPAAPVIATEPQFVQHKVSKSGETLTSISIAYTGKAANWTKIRDANPQLKPNKLPLGALVNIPAALVSKKPTAVKTSSDPAMNNLPSRSPSGDSSTKKPVPVKQLERSKSPAAIKPTPVEKKKPTEDLIQVKPSEHTEATMPRIEEEPVVDSVTTSTTIGGVGVVQDPPDSNAPEISPPSTVTAPPAADRIDPAPDKEREKLLDELLSK